MSNNIHLNSDFITTIEKIEFILKRVDFHFYLPERDAHHDILRTAKPTKNVDLHRLRRGLILLDESLARNLPYFHSDSVPWHHELQPRSEVWRWLSYDSIETIIPIYDEYIALASQHWIINPRCIPHVIDLICIPKSSNGLDIEHHQFGYHFHYGKVQKDKLVRSDLLLTFKPTPEPGESSPNHPHLYAENHGDGYKLNVEIIGNNKRKPIYFVCQNELSKKNRKDFKTPGQKSAVFYKNN